MFLQHTHKCKDNPIACINWNFNFFFKYLPLAQILISKCLSGKKAANIEQTCLQLRPFGQHQGFNEKAGLLCLLNHLQKHQDFYWTPACLLSTRKLCDSQTGCVSNPEGYLGHQDPYSFHWAETLQAFAVISLLEGDVVFQNTSGRRSTWRGLEQGAGVVVRWGWTIVSNTSIPNHLFPFQFPANTRDKATEDGQVPGLLPFMWEQDGIPGSWPQSSPISIAMAIIWGMSQQKGRQIIPVSPPPSLSLPLSAFR